MTPRKPNYPRMKQEDVERVRNHVKFGDDLMRRCGYKAPTGFNNGIQIPQQVPLWMDGITSIWLARGSSIPWEAFQAVIKAGMAGKMDEVEMFIFTWGDEC